MAQVFLLVKEKEMISGATETPPCPKEIQPVTWWCVLYMDQKRLQCWELKQQVFFFFFTDRLPPDVDEEALASKACGKYLSNSIESLQIAQSNRKPDQKTSK